MTLGAQAWGEDSKTYSGKDMREVAGMLADRGDAIESLVYSGLGVTQQTSAGTTVRVAAGRAIIAATESGKFGGYGVWNDALANSPAFAATSSNGRWDYLILRVTGGVPALEIVQGTAAGSPVAPTITGDNYVVLALVKLPPSTTNITTAMLTDQRPFGGRWRDPWGSVAPASSLATDAANGNGGVANAIDTGLSVAFTAIAGRRYRTTFTGHLYASVAQTVVSLVLADTSNVVKNQWDHEQGTFNSVFGGPAADLRTFAFTEDCAASGTTLAPGARVRKVRMFPQVGGGIGHLFADSTRIAQLTVDDVGPAANPAP